MTKPVDLTEETWVVKPFIRCVVCTLPVEVTSRRPAHDKVEYSAWCERCDATMDVILPPWLNGEADS